MPGRRTGLHFAWACSIVLAAEIRASFGFLFSIAPEGASLFSLPPKGRSPSSLPKREQSAVRRIEDRALARSTGPILPDRPRRMALHCGVLNPWGPASLWSGAVASPPAYPGRGKERALGVVMRREAGPRTPGTTSANRGRRRRSPSTFGSLARTPLCGWGCVEDNRMQTAVKINLS
jgi:hypothetical protein